MQDLVSQVHSVIGLHGHIMEQNDFPSRGVVIQDTLFFVSEVTSPILNSFIDIVIGKCMSNFDGFIVFLVAVEEGKFAQLKSSTCALLGIMESVKEFL